jgi:hypothetical protein
MRLKQILEAEGIEVPSQMVEKIRKLDIHIFGCEGRVKVLKEELQEVLEGHTAYQELQRAQAAVERARADLNRALQGDEDYNDLMEKIADENNDIKETKYSLSQLVVEYHAQTHAKQVEIGPNGDARELIVNGRLGKRGKLQMSLLREASPERDLEEEQLTLTEGE